MDVHVIIPMYIKLIFLTRLEKNRITWALGSVYPGNTYFITRVLLNETG